MSKYRSIEEKAKPILVAAVVATLLLGVFCFVFLFIIGLYVLPVLLVGGVAICLWFRWALQSFRDSL